MPLEKPGSDLSYSGTHKDHSSQAERAWRTPIPSCDHFEDEETGMESEKICSRSQGLDYNPHIWDSDKS